MKLLLDEMYPPRIASHLRDKGYDVVSVAEDLALRGMPDEELFLHALRCDRVIVTKNVIDFRPLSSARIAQGCAFPGILFVSDRRFPDYIPDSLGRLTAALEQFCESGLNVRNSEHWIS
jgi:hypothetical protein